MWLIVQENGMRFCLVGLTNAAAWLIWSWRVRQHQPYVWKTAVAVISALLLLLLELGDFPPIWWTFDAHSFWHAGTILLPLLWYRYVLFAWCRDLSCVLR